MYLETVMTVYFFNPDTPAVEEFTCNKLVAGVDVATAVNTLTNEQKQISYIHLLYVVEE